MVQTQGTDALFPQRPQSYPRTDRVRRGPRRIAVIEEDATLQQFMSTLLTDEGYTVIEWGSAEGAHALIRSEHPDAVLLDLCLEDAWSGMRLAEELRHDPTTTDTPVVLMAGDRHFLSEHRGDLTRLNCDVAVMPFDLNDLLETIGHCITSDMHDAAMYGKSGIMARSRTMGSGALPGYEGRRHCVYFPDNRHVEVKETVTGS